MYAHFRQRAGFRLAMLGKFFNHPNSFHFEAHAAQFILDKKIDSLFDRPQPIVCPPEQPAGMDDREEEEEEEDHILASTQPRQKTRRVVSEVQAKASSRFLHALKNQDYSTIFLSVGLHPHDFSDDEQRPDDEASSFKQQVDSRIVTLSHDRSVATIDSYYRYQNLFMVILQAGLTP